MPSALAASSSDFDITDDMTNATRSPGDKQLMTAVMQPCLSSHNRNSRSGVVKDETSCVRVASERNVSSSRSKSTSGVGGTRFSTTCAAILSSHSSRSLASDGGCGLAAARSKLSKVASLASADDSVMREQKFQTVA